MVLCDATEQALEIVRSNNDSNVQSTKEDDGQRHNPSQKSKLHTSQSTMVRKANWVKYSAKGQADLCTVF